MKSSPKLSYAVAAILGASAAGIACGAEAPGAAAYDQIGEVVVTAQRRTQNMQDVPITIQALTSETLTQLNVQTIDDFLRYLPNVTTASAGPGQTAIYMRGLSTTLPGAQGSGGIGSFPNVAVYLDEISGALPARNLDVYAADLERIEVLEGPQGTLFGAGAESGVLRYITNKPKLDVTEGNFSASYEVTAHGDPGSSLTGVLNLPLIADKLAIRAVVYNDKRGGYINNVPGTFSRQCSDVGINVFGYTPYAAACAANPNYTIPSDTQNSANNYALVKNGINPVTYQGFRLSALWKFNDDWNALLTQSYQSLDAEGVFYMSPHSSGSVQQVLPDLSVQNYVPTFDKDRFTNTALTINGRIGDLRLVYAGGYLVRNIDNVGDYTNYTRGYYADYYQCTPASGAIAGQCYSPVSHWHDVERNAHNSQEIRLSTPDDWRLRGIVGLFWEDYKINENIDWLYRNAPACSSTRIDNCFVNVGPPNGNPLLTQPHATTNNPAVRPDTESFFDDITRGYKQKAIFGSMDFDIVPKKLTLTVGTRYYRLNTTEVGFTGSSFNCLVAPGATTTTSGAPTGAPCIGNQQPYSPPFYAAANETASGLNITYSGFRSRANLSWKPTSDFLLYYTWSQGYRPGGYNRGALDKTTPAGFTFQEPQSFTPDTLLNNEIGWKSQWFDRRLEINGAIYQEDWHNVQTELFEPCCFGNLSFVINGPDYRVRGLELSVIARPMRGLSIVGGAAWNNSKLTSEPPLRDVNGNPINDPAIGLPFGALGSPLAQSPAMQMNARVRYDFQFNQYDAFIQFGGQHQTHAWSATSRTTQPDQPGYAYNEPAFSTYDLSAGISKDAWSLHLYGENITDTRADLYENPNQFVDAKTVNRPRVLGLRIGYKF